jgi:sugar phosphate isomerase/epimerase
VVRLPLVLCNVAVSDIALRDVIPAAARAGFDAMSIAGSAVRRSAERDGVGAAELAMMIRDHGLRVTDMEAVGDWLDPIPTSGPRWLDPGYHEAEFIELAGVFGAVNLVATHFGPTRSVPEATTAFARLCDVAADQGLNVALEYPAMATIGDVRTAWAVVSAADRPNGGILHDVWHHDRSEATDADLHAVPAERILSVQLSDAAAQRRGPLLEDIRHRRFVGEGDLDVVTSLRRLVDRGVACPLGIEVFTSFDPRPADERVQELYDNLRAAVVTAGLDPTGSASLDPLES